MRNRLIFILLLCASVAAAQVPSVTGNSLVQLREGNNAWISSLNTIFGAIDVDLTSGVTGILPVANGGTGVASLTANRIPYGNGTSAFQSSGNLTFNGSLLTVTGHIQGNLQSSSTPGITLSGTMTSTTNSQSWFALNVTPTYANDGTPTSQFYYGTRLTASTTTPTAASITTAARIENTNTSANVSQFYGIYGRIDENTTTGNLSNRAALRFDCFKNSDAFDSHTGSGIIVNVSENSSTGRWNSGIGLQANATNAISGMGISTTVSNTRGTGATQTGAQVTNTVSGSGVTAPTAYGLRLLHSTASGATITNYYGVYSNSTPAATNTYLLYNSTAFRNYLNGNVAIGVDVTTAKLFVRGAGTTSGTYNFITEKSDGTDVMLVRDDGNVAIGPTTPSSTVRLIVRGTTADNTAEGFEVQSSAGTPTFSVDNSGAVSVGNAAYQEKLTVNGKVRSDGLVLNSATDVTTDGHLIYNNASTNSGYLTIGDNSRAMAFIPAMIERHVIDYAVDWTTGRKGAFWTVPARFDGWKIAKAYIEVTSVGSGAGDDVLAIEIGGVTEGEQYVTAGTHTLVMDDVINTDDVITFNVTAISATAAKGLNVSLELSKQ